MIWALILVSSVGLHVEEVADLAQPEPLLMELKSAIEERTGASVTVSRCPCAASDEAVSVRVIGGVRRLLVVIERGQEKARIELELDPTTWRVPVWNAVRDLLPANASAPAVAAPVARAEPTPLVPWMFGAGGAVLLAGGALVVHSAVFRGQISAAGPEQTAAVFARDVDQANVEGAVGAALIAGVVGAVGVALIWSLVDW